MYIPVLRTNLVFDALKTFIHIIQIITIINIMTRNPKHKSDTLSVFLKPPYISWPGPVVNTPDNGRVDLCSSPLARINLEPNKQHYIFFV